MKTSAFEQWCDRLQLPTASVTSFYIAEETNANRFRIAVPRRS